MLKTHVFSQKTTGPFAMICADTPRVPTMNEPPVSATGIPDGITRDDVLRAIADLDRGDVPHGFRDSTGYDLLHDGKRYPPKAVIGLSARRLRGRILEPNEFSGGEDSKCFTVLHALGFQVVPKANAPGA